MVLREGMRGMRIMQQQQQQQDSDSIRDGNQNN
jgi:hypothetical protein